MPAAGSLVSYTDGASRVLLSPVWPGFSDPRQVYGVAFMTTRPGRFRFISAILVAGTGVYKKRVVNSV